MTTSAPFVAVSLVLVLAGRAAARRNPGTPPTRRAALLPRRTSARDEAALLVIGELVRIYGSDADPYAQDVRFTAEHFEGVPAWRADVIANLEIGGVRQQQRWTIWIGVRNRTPLVLGTEAQPRQ